MNYQRRGRRGTRLESPEATVFHEGFHDVINRSAPIEYKN